LIQFIFGRIDGRGQENVFLLVIVFFVVTEEDEVLRHAREAHLTGQVNVLIGDLRLENLFVSSLKPFLNEDLT
jgi:hypothetical protein